MAHLGSRSIFGAISLLGFLLCMSTHLHAAGTCGNGIEESSEECDPGGALHVNGDPTLATCASGNTCFFELSCCKFNCQYVGSGAPCADGNDCTTADHCDQVGRCTGAFTPNGDPCDDDVFCNGADTCQTGECVGHAGDPCAGNTDCVATCDEDANQCTSTPFIPCGDDGNACTDDVCDGNAACTHPALPALTICRQEASACDIPELCIGGGVPCPVDILVPNGTICGDMCTTGGTCQNGVCAGGIPLVCDDDDVCNGLETCNPATGCVPGETLDCSDGDDCTSDDCAPMGGCSNPVVADGSPCDDTNRCTLFDTCQAGVCTGPDVEVLALSKANFGADTVGSGNVSVSAENGAVKFSRGAFMADGSLVTANTLGLAANASLFDVITNKRKGPGIVRGSQSPAGGLPLGLSCPVPAVTCNSANPVVVPEKGVLRIGPGTYGDVKVGRRGTLELDPGEYVFCRMIASPPAAVRPRGDVIVRVVKDVKVVNHSILEPYAGAAQFLVAGKVKIGAETVVHRMAFSAGGQMALARFVQFDGPMCAQKIKGQKGLQFGCPLLPPP